MAEDKKEEICTYTLLLPNGDIKEVEFEPSKINILYWRKIINDGYITMLDEYNDNAIKSGYLVLCDEEGEMKNLPVNKAIEKFEVLKNMKSPIYGIAIYLKESYFT
jgi:hypothetical protein